MKPGDLIEWTYKYSDRVVDDDETLWSSIEGRHVPICGDMVHLIVHQDEKTFSWLNQEGLFHTRVDDTSTDSLDSRWRRVVPRVVQSSISRR